MRPSLLSYSVTLRVTVMCSFCSAHQSVKCIMVSSMYIYVFFTINRLALTLRLKPELSVVIPDITTRNGSCVF